jgi:hypothetical protein
VNWVVADGAGGAVLLRSDLNTHHKNWKYGARSGKNSVLGKKGWSVHMISQAGSASGGVAWISSLLTAFYGGVPLITTNGRFHEKKGAEGYICRCTLVIVYYSPSLDWQRREISANLVFSSRNFAFATR